MAYDIGPKVGIEGWAEFKSAVDKINENVKTLGTEMKAVTSAYDKNDQSAEKLTAQNEVLNKQIDAQKEKLAKLKEGLAAATDEFGEGDTRTLKWQASVNNATAALNKMERQLAGNTQALENMDSSLGKSQLEDSIKGIDQTLKTLGTEMAAVTSEYDSNTKSSKALKAQSEVLNKQITAQREKLDKLKEGLAAASKEFGETDARTLEWQASVNTATAELNGMEHQLKGLGKEAEGTGGKLSAMTVAMGTLISAGVEAAVSAVGELVSSLLNLDSATEEYRAAQGKLQTAYEAAGYSSDSAQTAYREFYKILGDTDTAVEASQLLAKLADNEQDLTKWTQIAAGVSGTFGDSLPIEGLIESANETAKVGQITGSLADALNWAGISEDEFNAKLAECTDESARNRLIMSTLSGTYDEASAAFYRNNEAIVAARDAQASLDESLGRVGEAVANIKTSVQADFMPSITQMLDGIAALASGDESGVDQLTQGITEFADTLAEKAPQAAEAAGQLMGALLEAISASLPSLLEAGGTVLGEIVSGILAGLPDMGAAGLELVTTLVQGISDSLPELIPAGMDAVLQLVETLTNPDSLGKFIDAALSLITSLAEGLIKALPTLAARTPEIIANIVTTLANNLPKIGKAAVDIIVTLAAGLIGAIPDLLKAVPRLITSIVGGFSKAGEDFRGIGKDIVTGVWTGIQNMGRWIRDKVTGFFSGITSAVKGVLGIHSPSRVYRGIGGNMGESVGLGWEDQYPKVKGQIVQNVDRIASDTLKAAVGTLETGRKMARSLDEGWDTQYVNVKGKITRSVDRIASDTLKAAVGTLETGRKMARSLDEGWDTQYANVKGKITQSVDRIASDTLKVAVGTLETGRRMARGLGEGWSGQYRKAKGQITGDMDRLTAQTAKEALEAQSNSEDAVSALVTGVAEQMEQLTAQAPDWGREFVDGLRQGIQAGGPPLLQDMGKLREDLRWAFSGEMAAAQRRLDRSMAQLPKEGSETAVHRRDWSKEENPLDYDALAQAVKRGLDGSVVSMSGRRVGQLITSYQQGERRAKGS